MDENFQKLIGWICREFKMMKNDTNMTCQLYNFEIENQLLNFCVDKNVGGKSLKVSRHVLKVNQYQFFDKKTLTQKRYSDF